MRKILFKEKNIKDWETWIEFLCLDVNQNSPSYVKEICQILRPQSDYGKL